MSSKQIGNKFFFNSNLRVLKYIALLLPLCNAPAFADTHSIISNLRHSIDASTRYIDVKAENESGYMHMLGVDMHSVWSDDNRDIGTFLLQGYFTRLDNIIRRPGFFDGPDDTRFVFRNFYFDYTGWGLGKPKVRFGHFEIPYGLEQTINTNGTIRDFTHGRNLGTKADWGMSVHNENESFEYDIAYTRGSIQDWDRPSGSFTYSARISTPREQNFAIGAAIYDSELNGIERTRFGIDTQWYIGLFGILSQVDIGNTDGDDVINGFTEFNWRSPKENIFLYWQTAYFSQEGANNDRQKALNNKAGIEFLVDQHWSLSTQYDRDNTVFSGKRQRTLILQIRYRS